MSELPENWEEASFGDVIRSVAINDKKLPRGQYAASGKFPVVDQGQEFIGGYSDDADRVVDEDFPLIVFGDHTRIFKFVNLPFVPGADGVKVLKPLGVDEKWLYHIAHALEFPDKGYARHFQHLKKARLLVPPLPEQRRIVARIEELFSRLDAGVAALRQAKAQLQRYRQSVLAAAVTGQLTQAWREQHPDTESADELLKRILKQRREQWDSRGKYKEPIGPISLNTHRIPESWSWSSADQLTEFVTDGEHQTPQRSDEGILLLSARNVHNGRLNLEKVDYVPEHEYERISKRLVVLEGDVLLSCSGSVGRTCVAPASPKFTLVRSVAVLRPLLAMGKFMSCALQGPALQAQINEKKSQTAQANIFQGKIKTLTFPLPPLAEQHQIVAEVEARTTAIDHLEAELDRQITRSNRLRQSTLKSAYNGSLS